MFSTQFVKKSKNGNSKPGPVKPENERWKFAHSLGNYPTKQTEYDDDVFGCDYSICSGCGYCWLPQLSPRPPASLTTGKTKQPLPTTAAANTRLVTMPLLCSTPT